MTAGEFRKNKNILPTLASLKISDGNYKNGDERIEELMIDFAKYHVKQALQQASENADADFEPMGWLAEQHFNTPFIEGEDYEIGIIRNSILNSYDLNNIK